MMHFLTCNHSLQLKTHKKQKTGIASRNICFCVTRSGKFFKIRLSRIKLKFYAFQTYFNQLLGLFKPLERFKVTEIMKTRNCHDDHIKLPLCYVILISYHLSLHIVRHANIATLKSVYC